MILYLSQHFVGEECLYGFGRDRVEGVVYGDADALLALAHAEGAAKLHLVAQVMLGDETLDLSHDLARALDVAGAADANGNFHHDCIPL